MKATYQAPGVGSYANWGSYAKWLLDFGSIGNADFGFGLMWMIARNGVEIFRVGDSSVLLVLPDDNPNPFTTDALRPGAAVGAAELGAVLTTAGNPLGGSHPVHYALMDKVNGLCYCTHSGAIRLSTRPLISGDELYGWRIHSFPPFTDPL